MIPKSVCSGTLSLLSCGHIYGIYKSNFRQLLRRNIELAHFEHLMIALIVLRIDGAMGSGGAHFLRGQQVAYVDCVFIWTTVPELFRAFQPSDITSRQLLVTKKGYGGGVFGDGVEGGEVGTLSGA